MKSHSIEETFKVASEILTTTSRPHWFLLQGGLGVGKTHLAKGFGMALGISAEAIQSPTFVYLSVLKGKDSETHNELQYFHFDLYRLENPKEADDMIAQYQEHFSGNVVVIEWSERLSEAFRKQLLSLGFRLIQCEEYDTNKRMFTLVGDKR